MLAFICACRLITGVRKDIFLSDSFKVEDKSDFFLRSRANADAKKRRNRQICSGTEAKNEIRLAFQPEQKATGNLFRLSVNIRKPEQILFHASDWSGKRQQISFHTSVSVEKPESISFHVSDGEESFQGISFYASDSERKRS